MHKQRLYKDPHNQTACVWCVCTYHEHVPVRFTDGYIEDTGIHWVVCRESKMANRGLGFRLKEGRMCACFGGEGDREKEHIITVCIQSCPCCTGCWCRDLGNYILVLKTRSGLIDKHTCHTP